MIFLPSIRLTLDMQAAIESGALRVQTGQWVHNAYALPGSLPLRGRVVSWGASSSVIWWSSGTWAEYSARFRAAARRLFRPFTELRQLDLFSADNIARCEQSAKDELRNVYGSYRKFRELLAKKVGDRNSVRHLIESYCPGWRFHVGGTPLAGAASGLSDFAAQPFFLGAARYSDRSIPGCVQCIH